MHRSLSEYIALLEREGELVRIAAPVSPVEEIAEITDRVSKMPGGGKALLFENTGTDFPVLTNMFGSARRMALALGVGSLGELSERVDGLLRQAMAPRPSFADKLRALPLLAGMSRWFPRTVSGRGECQQVVQTGAEASLAALPILKCWPADGGRFVTLPMVNTVDPQTGVRNVGMYRMQVFDDHTTGMHWHIHKTRARHYDAWKRSGRRMPVSVALGGDPAYTYAATAPMPDNMDEYLLAGFLRRRPVKLVKCVTNDIYVPADCDFVIEGYVDPAEEKAVEGPFGESVAPFALPDPCAQHFAALRRPELSPALQPQQLLGAVHHERSHPGMGVDLPGLFQRVELPSQAQVAVHGFGRGVGRREEEHLRTFPVVVHQAAQTLLGLRQMGCVVVQVHHVAVEADAVEEEETYEREQQDRRHQRAVPVGTHSREPLHPFQHGRPPPAILLTDQVGQQDEAEQRRSDQCQRSEEPEVAQ